MKSNENLCAEFQTKFDLYELNLEQPEAITKQEMEEHFDSCPQCQRWLSNWELIKLSTSRLKQFEPPLTIISNVIANIAQTAEHANQTATSTTTAISPTAAGAMNVSAQAGSSMHGTPPFIKSDLLIGLGALTALLVASIHYGAEGLEGTESWCLSFFILLAVHQLLKMKDKEQYCKI